MGSSLVTHRSARNSFLCEQRALGLHSLFPLLNLFMNTAIPSIWLQQKAHFDRFPDVRKMIGNIEATVFQASIAIIQRYYQ
jgi:hypothetical protein